MFNLRCWFNRGFLIGFLIVPICLIVLVNIIIIGIIIRVKVINYNDDILKKSTNGLSSTKLDVLTLLTCLLFSGLTWIFLPIGLASDQAFTKAVIYFFSIINSLQGLFLFIHFFVTYQVILGKSRVHFFSKIASFIFDDSEDSDDKSYSKNE